MRQPCNRMIAGSQSSDCNGRSAIPFSKEFNLTMVTMVALATALRAAWDKIS